MKRVEDPTHPLIRHLELCFGKIERGWDVPLRTRTPKINIVRCRGGLVATVTVVSTVGFSHVSLKSTSSTKMIRQGLFLMMKDGQLDGRMPGVISQIVEERLISQTAILRGEAISKPGTLFGKGDFVALYATMPVYYPKERRTFHGETGDVVLCWLLPIRAKELSYITQHGWSKFEMLLENAPFDLFDLDRPDLL